MQWVHLERALDCLGGGWGGRRGIQSVRIDLREDDVGRCSIDRRPVTCARLLMRVIEKWQVRIHLLRPTTSGNISDATKDKIVRTSDSRSMCVERDIGSRTAYGTGEYCRYLHLWGALVSDQGMDAWPVDESWPQCRMSAVYDTFRAEEEALQQAMEWQSDLDDCF